MTPNKSKLEVSQCCKVNESAFGTCANCGLPFIHHTNTEEEIEHDNHDPKYCTKCKLDDKSLPPPVDKDWQVEEREAFRDWWEKNPVKGTGYSFDEDEIVEKIVKSGDFWLERIRIAREEVAHFYKVTKTGKLGRQDMEKAFQAGRQQGQKELIENIKGMKKEYSTPDKSINRLNHERIDAQNEMLQDIITKYEIEI